MTSAKVLNEPEDYARIGVKPGVVEPWEDGRRRDSSAGVMENWYFDANMDDNTKVVLSFRPRLPETMQIPGDSPNLNIYITTSDGKTYSDFIKVPIEDSETRKGECYVKYGPHTFTGQNLTDYQIHVEPVNGVGCDLKVKVLTKPFRPGTGYVAFEDDTPKVLEYTWTCFPRCEAAGTVTACGRTWEVHGVGYHDHQWHNTNPIAIIHHWLWGRSYTENYTVAMLDIVANQKYGFTQIPIFCVIDNHSGEVIFQNLNGGTSEVLEDYYEPKTAKRYPKISRYYFDHDDMQVEYVITQKQELEVRGSDAIMGEANAQIQEALKAKGLDPSYCRYFADTRLTITKNGKSVTESGTMIYEFPYIGVPDPRAHLDPVVKK